MKIALRETRLGLRNSTTRIPFRYGNACLTRCPQATLGATIESEGKLQTGYSGDCLPPGWFDKTPGRPFSQQIKDMLAVIAASEAIFREEFARPVAFFPAWRVAEDRIHQLAVERKFTPLLASFGVSLVERAMLDAICRAQGVPFAEAVRGNLFGIEAGVAFSELRGLAPAQWLPPAPRLWVYVRHTIGLADPLTVSEIAPDDRLNDGVPQALEEYIEQTGVRCFKVKVSNQLERDLERLETIATLAQRRLGSEYLVTLDGNEQYKSAGEFDRLIDAIQSAPKLADFWRNVLVVEQPLERKIALEATHTDGVRDLGKRKPVIIDESDGTPDAYPIALELGYRGVSSKNCKGAIRSLLNAGLTWLRNDRGLRSDYVMTGEDLCSVGIIPVQADLCLAATLGLAHVERNGHHYHPGLSYLPPAQQEAALAAHPDFYHRHAGAVRPRLVDGRFEIASLQCAGYGFAVEPDFATMESPETWDYGSLGLE
jgi:L-alanine-DL-glutamate epimerase-like enolase superfamily enzyme